MEQYGPGKIQESAEDKWSIQVQAKGPAEAREPAEAMEEKVPKGASFMLRYAVPAFFIIFGLIYIAKALMRLIIDESDQADLPQILMGLLFLFFGIISFLKARKMTRGTASSSGGRQEAKRPTILMRK
jgi:hypothetical protein